MADAYWRYGDGRQEPATLPSHMAKRPRSEFEMPSSHDFSGYYAREDIRPGQRINKDTDTVNASYERYLRGSISSYGGEAGRSTSAGFGGHYHADDPPVIAMGGLDPTVAAKSLSVGMGRQPEIALPPDASNTLFVECLPANCTRREVSHIFRPFIGYKEVRLVTKESRHPGGDPLVLCFVDFQSPAHAATAMDALQGETGACFALASYIKALAAQIFHLYSPPSFFAVLVQELSMNMEVLKNIILDCEWHNMITTATNSKGSSYLLTAEVLMGYKFDEHDRDSSHLKLQFARYPVARSGSGRRGRH